MVKQNFNSAIIVSADDCGACDEQKRIIKNYFRGRNTKIPFINVDKNNGNVPKEIKDSDGSFSTPTFILYNKGEDKIKILPGVTDDPDILELLYTGNSNFGKRKPVKSKKPVKAKKPVKQRVRFGNIQNVIPQLDTLAIYGKNFPDGKGFQIPNSYITDNLKNFNNSDSVLAASMMGISNQKDLDNILNNSNYNIPRQVSPNDPLGAMQYLNRTCNIARAPSTMIESPGLIYDSKNQLTVPMTTFGKRKKVCKEIKNCKSTKTCKSKKKCKTVKKCKERKTCKKTMFGSKLYNQMGDAYENAPLNNWDTVKNLYGGGIQDNLKRPLGVNTDLYIGGFPTYNPIKFGRKIKKIKEGSVLTIKRTKKGKNKIKVSN